MIFGPDGKPTKLETNENLSLLIRTSVELAVNTEMRRLDKNNSLRFWVLNGARTVAALVVGFFLYMYGPDKVEEWTQKYVNENMNKESFAKAADLAMDDRIKPYIDNKISPLEVRSRDLEGNLKTSETHLTQLREKQQFLLLVFRAENYDFYAFSELEGIVKIHNELSLEAMKVINNIKGRLIQERQDRFIFKYFMLEDTPHIRYYPDIYSPEEALETLIKGNRELAADMVRLGGFISLVPWMINVLETESNINILNRITDAISAFAGYQFYPWDIPRLLVWFEKVKHRYKQFDYPSYKSGLNEFFRGKWKLAIEHFDKAIESDSRADISRSLSIFCSIQENDINTANNMLKGFRDQTYNKWAILARAKILLSQGDIVRGTELLIDLSIKNPRMEEFILMGQEVFLNEADWQLYHKRRNFGRWTTERQN